MKKLLFALILAGIVVSIGSVIVFVVWKNSFGNIFVKNLPPIDKEMAQYVSTLSSSVQRSQSNCTINTQFVELPKIDQFSLFAPQELTLFYNGNKITSLAASEGRYTNIADVYDVYCLRNQDYVYVFLYPTSAASLFYNLPEGSYITFSKDNGFSWSELKNFQSIFDNVMPPPEYTAFYTTTVLGDESNFALVIYSSSNATSYLFSPKFVLLKKSSLERGVHGNTDFKVEIHDFYFHDGIIYTVQEYSNDGKTYVEFSDDYGKSWQRELMDEFARQSYFTTYNGLLYQFYTAPCKSPGISFIPALDRKEYACGKLLVRNLREKGTWSDPIVLSNTVHGLIAVYIDKNPILVWTDARFDRPKLCGFIPFVGCVDSLPFTTPGIGFAGKVNIKTFELEETVIYNELSTQ